MILKALGAILVMLAGFASTPALGQITVLDQAQDNAASPAQPAAPPPICGSQPLNIAAMGWPSAALLANIHSRLLAAHFDCNVTVTPGDMAATGSSMATTGQPAVVPEMWIGRIAEVWNSAINARMVRPAAPTYTETVFEGWFVPGYLFAAHPDLTATALREVAPTLNGGDKLRFISCPIDWGCSVINRNLIRALGLTDLLDIVEPANRFEMDTLIAEAVSRQEPVVFYYWQPNAVLAQFDFAPLDLGPFNQEALTCLADRECAEPVVSSFAPESVVIALAEWVFTDAPAIAAYFGRSAMPLGEMDKLLAQLNEPGATIEGVADRFVAEREDLWRIWVGTTP